MTTDPQTDRPRALHLLEAADFLRDAHFRDGLSVQEAVAALRHMADEADPMVGSLARDGLGLDEIAAMPAAPSAAVSPPPATDRAGRSDRYAAAIHDAMEPDLSLVDQEPGCQALFARAAEAAVALADTEQAELRRERDLAIAHDRQPYPTAWAYEQACKALHRKTGAIERVRSVLESEAVVGRSALEYRGLIASALLADEEQQAETQARECPPGVHSMFDFCPGDCGEPVADEPAPDVQFGVDDCTCIPFTRQTDPPRYLNRPTDTVDMISGWERGGDCPHHAPPTPLAKVMRWVESEPVTANTEFGNGYRECQRDIRDLLKGRFDNDAANELRRLAAGERDEQQAWPPRHRWSIETRDDLADEWAPGTPITDHGKAVERYEHVTKNWPTWKDGTPVQRRLVRATTTYTVETPAAAPVAGQPPADTGEEARGDFEAGLPSETGPKGSSNAVAEETVHGCPPDGSGLTPCCGRTPFELPLGDRISSEAPVTCKGA